MIPSRPFPWDVAMAFGLGVLRLAPREFWTTTPRELAAAYRAFTPAAGHDPPDSGALAALMAAFPDGDRHGT